MKKLLACLAYLLSLVKVSAQSSACVAVAGSLLCLTTETLAQSVQQSGTVTPGHAAMWTANGVIKDAGTAANGFLTSLGVTNNGGPGVCVNSGPITGPYNAMCLNTSSTTGGMLSVYNYNGATGGFTISLNGTLQGFPTVSGLPVSINASVCFADTTGTLKACTSSNGILYATSFGVTCDGVTNDTASMQAAETAREAVGGVLVFPAGVCMTSGITVNRANGGGIQGNGTIFKARANGVVIMDASGASVGVNAPVFTIEGVHFHGGGFANVTGYREAAAYMTRLTKLNFTNVVYSTIFNRGYGIAISDITQYGSGQWLFTGVGTGVPDRVFDITIDNFQQLSVGGSSWTAPSLFYFYRAVNITMSNVMTSSLDGAATGILLQGAVEGFFASNVILVYPTTGISSVIGPDSVYPAYVYLTNFAVDQPTITGFDLNATVLRLTSVNSTFGDARTNAGVGIAIGAASSDVVISSSRISNMYNTGLYILNGATNVRVSDLTVVSTPNGGTGYGVDINATTAAQVSFYGSNTLGTIHATGQTLINGQSAIAGLGLYGATSGTVAQVAQSVAGTPTVTWGTSSGTPAVTASAPLGITAATGNITCATCGLTSGTLAQFSATTSAQLAGNITDETGTAGSLVFSTNPVFNTSILTPLIYGGSAVGSTLTLQSTSSGSPAGDSVVLRANGAAQLTAASTGVTLGSQLLLGPGTYASGVAKIYTDATYGVVYNSGTGASYDLSFINANGQISYGAVHGSNDSLVGGPQGHIRTSMLSAPVLTACGTTPTIVGTDIGGTVTMGTGSPTGCVITFYVAYVNPPHCVVSWQTNLASMQYTITNAAITLVQTATSSNKVNYKCVAGSSG